jgi:hypothetical protein
MIPSVEFTLLLSRIIFCAKNVIMPNFNKQEEAIKRIEGNHIPIINKQPDDVAAGCCGISLLMPIPRASQ